LDAEYTIIEKDFQHVVLEGTAYEVGQQQGEILKRQNPEAARWYASGKTDPKKLGFKDFEELRAFYEEYSPGITDEIQGLADGLGVKPDNLQIYNPPIYQSGNCSQFAVLSSVTDDRHVYVGRSYEYHHNENDFACALLGLKEKSSIWGSQNFFSAETTE